MSDQVLVKSESLSMTNPATNAVDSSTLRSETGIQPLDSTGLGRVPEILAPVGGREQFFAALNAGADAVFLGLKQFNARARADNFSIEDLQSLVPLAHHYGMQVLVTLNILIKDIELEELIHTLAELEDVGIDAIIVQDLGVAKIAREFFPGLRLHASTQMAVHNLAGVREAWSYGFKRVVLARELTAEELKRIRRGIAGTDVEIEVFCHGSLCYSYSGLCFFSGASDARSGNRGECAYTCREPYKVVSEPGHGFLFSMRDLDTSHKLDQMVLAGVDTLKIEGRKKDAQYVTSVVRLYRKKLDDLFGCSTIRDNAPPLAREPLESEPAIRKDLQLSFQRKTTSFFFEGRYRENVIDLNSPTHNGIRIGVIESITGQSISVRLEDDVEKFDGLKIVPADKLFHARPQDGETAVGNVHALALRYENREVAFSLREMSFMGRKIYEATTGMLVEMELPGGASARVGDILFKARSGELRRRVEKMIGVPVGARLRPMISVRATISAVPLDNGGMRLGITIHRGVEVIAEGYELFDVIEERQKGELIHDLKDVFHIFGDEGVHVEAFTFDLVKNYFIPKSRLKDLKRRVEVGLNLAATSVSIRHMDQALISLSQGWKALLPASSAHYVLKIDRVEYLPWLAEMISSGIPITEVVFEPKKMFLPGSKPETFLKPLFDFQNESGIKIRLAIPTVVRAWDEPVLKKWFAASLSSGISAFEIGNTGGLGLLREWQIPLEDVTSDFMLYGMNREAIKHWRDCGVKQLALSIEDDAEDIQSLLNHWPENVLPQVILYKDTPLFLAEACSLTALHNGCPSSKVCGYRTLEIENTKGERFFVAHEGCKSVVYGKQAYSIAGERKRLMKFGVASFRIDFLTRDYDQQSFTSIVNAVINDQKIPGTHPANFLGRLK